MWQTATRRVNGQRRHWSIKPEFRVNVLRDQNAAKRTYQDLVKKYGNIEGTEESVRTAKQELRLMGASIPEPTDQSLTSLERTLERQRQRRERDRPRSGVERSPAMGEKPDYSASGFGVDPEEIMRPLEANHSSGGRGQLVSQQFIMTRCLKLLN